VNKKDIAAKKRAFFAQLFQEMKYCPMCGEELGPPPGARTGNAFKTCKAQHGIMYVTGQGAGARVPGMFLELVKEW
jgi:hypothetical protein